MCFLILILLKFIELLESVSVQILSNLKNFDHYFLTYFLFPSPFFSGPPISPLDSVPWVTDALFIFFLVAFLFHFGYFYYYTFMIIELSSGLLLIPYSVFSFLMLDFSLVVHFGLFISSIFLHIVIFFTFLNIWSIFIIALLTFFFLDSCLLVPLPLSFLDLFLSIKFSPGFRSYFSYFFACLLICY